MGLGTFAVALAGVGLITLFYVKTSSAQNATGPSGQALDPVIPEHATSYRRARMLYRRGQWHEAEAVLRHGYNAVTANALWHQILNEPPS